MQRPVPGARLKILIVDDDEAVTALVDEYLSQNDLQVVAAANGAQMQAAMAQHPDVALVLMDLRLPGENGFHLARALRETNPLPLIMLTGQTEEADRVMGLELVADDYVIKPFSPRELLARIRAVLRRYEAGASRAAAVPALPAAPSTPALRGYRFAGWELNLGSRRLKSPQGEAVALSNGEFGLLHALCRAPGRVLSREQMLDLTRVDGAAVYDRAIDVQILRLRRKIEPDPTEPRYIRTERGAGYCFDVPVEPFV